jgi:polysaccharide biosynthesis transport protein
VGVDRQPIYEWSGEPASSPAFVVSAVQRANRRRLLVFAGTLIVALAVSMAYTFLRPPLYRVSSRIDITPAGAPPSSSPSISLATEPVKPFLTEVQALTSRPLLEEVARRLRRVGYRVDQLGPDPVGTMQAQIEATAVENTNVVELVAKGANAVLLPPLVNTIVEAYRDRLVDAYRSSSNAAFAQADAEVAKLESGVAAKRREVEAFRQRSNIVSLERDENDVLARVRGQSATLAKAEERVATAEGNLRALTDAQAAGNRAVRAKDNPTLANLEQRVSQAREELRDLERTYTPDYLAKEPRAAALRARIEELDRQLAEQRGTVQQTALAEAREELAAAQAAAARTRTQMTADRQDVARFAASFNEYKARQDALAELEKVYRDAVARRARLQASEQGRAPNVRVLENATAPEAPWRPLYWRDAAISAGGSLLLALLAMWLVELFNRSEPSPSVIVAQTLSPGIAMSHVPRVLPRADSAAAPLAHASPALLAEPHKLPRELRSEEIGALLGAAEPPVLLAIALLLSGLDSDEALALRTSDIDLAGGTIRAAGERAREIALSEPLRKLLARAGGADERLVPFGDAHSPAETLDAQILCAAHDARLQAPGAVDAACLRHTFIAFLVRQGIRFSDLQRIVGALPAPLLSAYVALSPSASTTAREAIDPVPPALRQLESG